MRHFVNMIKDGVQAVRSAEPPRDLFADSELGVRLDMYIFTTFTPPKLTQEQKMALAQCIQAIGRDEFIFALRKYVERPPVPILDSSFLEDVIENAENNKIDNKNKFTKIYFIISFLIFICAFFVLVSIDIKIIRLMCLYIVIGLPVAMLYRIGAWHDMETWVADVLQERSERQGEEISSRTPPSPQGQAPRIEGVAYPKANAPESGGGIDLQSGACSTSALMEEADASIHVHEMAYEWLEQFRRDAANPLAPQQLRADWETIKRWLGGPADVPNAGDAEELSVAAGQRECFARGFEQYMREGNAPIRELSEVFSRYKVLLAESYPKRSDINIRLTPEIRAVFGRMIVGHYLAE